MKVCPAFLKIGESFEEVRQFLNALAAPQYKDVESDEVREASQHGPMRGKVAVPDVRKNAL